MKKVIYLILWLIFTSNSFAQQQNYPFYDALKLKGFIKDSIFNPKVDTLERVASILKPYLVQPDIYSQADAFQLLKSFTVKGSPNFNPYLKPFLKLPNSMAEQFSGSVMSEQIRGGTASWKGIDVTNIVVGLADFMIERGKEELTATFFEKFQAQIKDTTYKELQILFPETYFLLSSPFIGVSNFNTYLNSLRETFMHDMSNIYSNFPRVMDQGKFQQFFIEHKELKAILTSSLFIVDNLAKKKHPGIILENLPLNDIDMIGDKKLSASIRFLKIFSQSLRSISPDHYWIPPDSLDQLFDKDMISFRVFLGLLYQQLGGMDSTYKPLLNYLAEMAPNLESLQQCKGFIEDFTYRTYDLRLCMEKIKKEQPEYNDYYQYYNSAINLIEMVDRLDDLPFLKIKISNEFGKYVYVARRCGDIYLNVNQNSYSSAVINTVSVLDTLLSDYIVKHKKLKDALQLIVKYGTFMSNIANAKDSKEVQAAIEAAALPPGSSIIKTYSYCNIAINSYLGGFSGHEWIKGVTDGLVINTYGIWAPVGVAVSVGSGGKKIGAVTFFGSVVDIGAVAAYRVLTPSDSSQQVPTITLESIISPGFYVILSRLFNSPVSLGAGYQYCPSLRKVNIDQNEIVTGATRLSLFLAVDIPLFNIYTKPRLLGK